MLAVISIWSQVIFLAAADCKLFHSVLPRKHSMNAVPVVMILRVWVVYHRSRWILGIILALDIVKTIVRIVVCVIYSTPGPSGISGMGSTPLWNEKVTLTYTHHVLLAG